MLEKVEIFSIVNLALVMMLAAFTIGQDVFGRFLILPIGKQPHDRREKGVVPLKVCADILMHTCLNN